MNNSQAIYATLWLLEHMTEYIPPEIGTGQRGRPHVKEGQTIDEALTECYVRGYTAAFVIQKTRLNKNTVYDKYRELDALILETPAANFDEEKPKRKSQYYCTIEDLISRNYEILEIIEKQIKMYQNKNVDIPAHLFQRFNDLTKNLFNLQQKKIAQSMKIPPDLPMWVRGI
ncbi:MAG TPA: hypothetical protein VJ571_02090 [Candidatus Nitrosotalea sp.]|nr:hypothetical protein [Candidatus Nitrosotalea sp.]